MKFKLSSITLAILLCLLCLFSCNSTTPASDDTSSVAVPDSSASEAAKQDVFDVALFPSYYDWALNTPCEDQLSKYAADKDKLRDSISEKTLEAYPPQESISVTLFGKEYTATFKEVSKKTSYPISSYTYEIPDTHWRLFCDPAEHTVSSLSIDDMSVYRDEFMQAIEESGSSKAIESEQDAVLAAKSFMKESTYIGDTVDLYTLTEIHYKPESASAYSDSYEMYFSYIIDGFAADVCVVRVHSYMGVVFFASDRSSKQSVAVSKLIADFVSKNDSYLREKATKAINEFISLSPVEVEASDLVTPSQNEDTKYTTETNGAVEYTAHFKHTITAKLSANYDYTRFAVVLPYRFTATVKETGKTYDCEYDVYVFLPEDIEWTVESVTGFIESLE